MIGICPCPLSSLGLERIMDTWAVNTQKIVKEGSMRGLAMAPPPSLHFVFASQKVINSIYLDLVWRDGVLVIHTPHIR